MKITRLILAGMFAFVSSTELNAQGTYPYLDMSSTWYVSAGNVSIFNTSIRDIKYYLEGDSLIENETYFKLYKNESDSTWDTLSEEFLGVEYTEHEYSGALREDSLKRFHVVYPNQSDENLLFDFNLELGDSAPDMIADYGCNDSTNVVSAVGYFDLGSTELKGFNFSNFFPNKTLYEGIGASGGLIEYGSLCQFFESGACLDAYTKGVDSVFIGCGNVTTSLMDISLTNFVRIHPNPAADHVVFLNQSSQELYVQLFNGIGKEVLSEKLPSDSESTRINTTNLSEGLYYWVVTHQKEMLGSGKLIISR